MMSATKRAQCYYEMKIRLEKWETCLNQHRPETLWAMYLYILNYYSDCLHLYLQPNFPWKFNRNTTLQKGKVQKKI